MDDLSEEAMQELQGHFSLAVDFETGCKSTTHKDNPEKICKESCALKPGSQYGVLQQVQLCGPDKKVHIVRMDSRDWTRPESPHLINILERVPVKLVHFTYFELGWALNHLNLYPTGLWLCTKIANQILFPEAKQSLNNLAEQHLDIEILKDDELWKWGWAQEVLSERQIEYSAHDIIHLHDLYRELLGKMSREQVGTWHAFCNTQLDLVKLECSTRVERKVLGRM
jgi:ribonuclease D